jgi:hypothetical protein
MQIVTLRLIMFHSYRLIRNRRSNQFKERRIDVFVFKAGVDKRPIFHSGSSDILLSIIVVAFVCLLASRWSSLRFPIREALQACP